MNQNSYLRFSPYTKQITLGMLLYLDKMVSKLMRHKKYTNETSTQAASL